MSCVGRRVDPTAAQRRRRSGGPHRQARARHRGGRAARAGPAIAPSTSIVDLRRPGVGSRLDNPILVASGTFGYGIEYGDVVDIQRLGAICCKGTTLRPRVGNLTPRVTETPAGMLNSIGLQNPGVDAVVDKYAADVGRLARAGDRQRRRRVDRGLRRGRPPARRRARGGRDRAQHQLPQRRQGRPPVRDRRRGRRSGDGGRARAPPSCPCWSSCRPNVADVRPIARAIEAAGADAITAINTLSGIAVGPGRRRPLLGNIYGGLSGPAIKPVALRVVYEVAQVVDIPIIAIGGVAELGRRARLPGGRRGRGPGRHGAVRRPDAAGPPRRRAGGRVPPPRPDVVPPR